MKTVLVVDDSPMIRRIAKKILEELNFKTGEAEDGQKALVAVSDSMPDAILLDWNMPVMDGLAFLVHLRQLPNGATPKVLFCTTESDVKHITRAMQAGADEYIMKPFDGDILEAKFVAAGLIQ